MSRPLGPTLKLAQTAALDLITKQPPKPDSSTSTSTNTSTETTTGGGKKPETESPKSKVVLEREGQATKDGRRGGQAVARSIGDEDPAERADRDHDPLEDRPAWRCVVTSTSPSFPQIKAQLAAIRKKYPHTRSIAIRSKAKWTGQERQEEGGEVFLIRQCDSPLAMRLALREGGDEVTRVLITDLDDHEIGDDILVRLRPRKLVPIETWQIVRSLFQVRAIDPRITRHRWDRRSVARRNPDRRLPTGDDGLSRCGIGLVARVEASDRVRRGTARPARSLEMVDRRGQGRQVSSGFGRVSRGGCRVVIRDGGGRGRDGPALRRMQRTSGRTPRSDWRLAWYSIVSRKENSIKQRGDSRNVTSAASRLPPCLSIAGRPRPPKSYACRSATVA
jgi:hypothetical protein